MKLLRRILLTLAFLMPFAAMAQSQCGFQAGGAICPNGLCCSQFGACGWTLGHCCGGCQSNCWSLERCGFGFKSGGVSKDVNFFSVLREKNSLKGAIAMVVDRSRVKEGKLSIVKTSPPQSKISFAA